MLINAYGLPKNGEDPVQQALYKTDANVQYPLLLRLEKYMDEHGEEKTSNSGASLSSVSLTSQSTNEDE